MLCCRPGSGRTVTTPTTGRAGSSAGVGPIPGTQYPLLTDAQILALLCEGSPFYLQHDAVGRTS